MQKRQRESEEAMEEDIKFDTDVLIKMDQELDKMRRIEEETRQATNQALLLEQEEFILQQEESLARAQTQNELMGALFDIQNQPETGGIDLALQPTRDSPLPKSILPARKSITRRQDNVGELRRVTQPAWTFDAPPDVSPEGDPEVQRRMTLEELAQAAQNQLEEMENREFEKAQNDTKAIEKNRRINEEIRKSNDINDKLAKLEAENLAFSETVRTLESKKASDDHLQKQLRRKLQNMKSKNEAELAKEKKQAADELEKLTQEKDKIITDQRILFQQKEKLVDQLNKNISDLNAKLEAKPIQVEVEKILTEYRDSPELIQKNNDMQKQLELIQKSLKDEREIIKDLKTKYQRAAEEHIAELKKTWSAEKQRDFEKLGNSYKETINELNRKNFEKIDALEKSNQETV